MSQSISDVMKIFIDELKSLGANIGSPEFVAGGMKISEHTSQWTIQAYTNEEFPETTIQDLAKRLVAKAQTFCFKELVLPKSGVDIACSCRKGNILFRYLEAHDPGSDKVLKRIDVLV